MVRKNIFIVMLALVLCFTLAFAAEAAQPTAKDVLIENIGNFNLGVSKDYYEKSRDETTINITRFDGSLVKDLASLKGASIDLLTQMDATNNVIKISYTTDIKGNDHNGDIYLKDDKVILTRDFFALLRELGFDAFKENPALLEQSHEYLYLSNEQLKSVWEQMASYQNQQLPEEYKELLLFLVEAIPDQYFSQSGDKVTLQLDQDGVAEFIYNLLAKVKAEKERAAGIIVDLNKYSFEQLGTTPEQMKQEIISGFDSIPVIPLEQIKLFKNFVDVKDFTYEASLSPGGPRNFNVNLGFKAPDGSMNGQFVIAYQGTGIADNLQGTYNFLVDFNAQNGPQFNFALDCLFNYKGEAAYADTTFQVAARDNATGELLLDLGATAKSVTKVDQSLVVNAPVLNDGNSTDISSLIPDPAQDMPAPPVGEETGLQIVVDGNILTTGVPFSVKDNGDTMVPARAVLEVLGYGVKWIKPNEMQVTTGDKTISVFINENSYKVNGVDKTLSIPAYLEAGYTMIPVSLIADENLATSIDLVNETTLMITK
ncbi:copper amine oxidase N-terminal domain-containing protein [Desulfallas thermosapovorans]|uniref:Copper amine oxidase-like protein n=1 Tax=Desulfallas thermosapovorans DSM 6562 TaxID=1121431 RepID=A0A5S4ZNW6_9FIRM|nr:copper amine oxidase N-terminal domain-containing protein [Desulfallas thermosapovorans]TYO94445.1 copper amine oxidase-like protein [Desulfallas thermosapovorans DSM 6562]